MTRGQGTSEHIMPLTKQGRSFLNCLYSRIGSKDTKTIVGTSPAPECIHWLHNSNISSFPLILIITISGRWKTWPREIVWLPFSCHGSSCGDIRREIHQRVCLPSLSVHLLFCRGRLWSGRFLWGCDVNTGLSLTRKIVQCLCLKVMLLSLRERAHWGGWAESAKPFTEQNVLFRLKAAFAVPLSHLF